MLVSVVCVYNNKNILDECLLSSLKNQNIQYELILVDNTKNEFLSASQALNNGGSLAKGKYILFSHQDICFKSSDVLKKMGRLFDQNPNSIIGVAGVDKRRRVISKITHGIDREILPGKITEFDVCEVQTVDECFFGISNELFKKFKFNEQIIDGWHLYAVEYCLRLKKHGIKTFVVGISNIHHRSIGSSMNDDYYRILKNLIKEYKTDYKFIYTTMGNWPTNIFLLDIKILILKALKSILSKN